MAMVALLLGVTALSVIAPSTEAFRVLGLYPFAAHSHIVMTRAAMEVLAERGHEVVMFSPFPQKKARANYTDIDISERIPPVFSRFTLDYTTATNGFKMVDLLAAKAGANHCRLVFGLPQFQDIMAGKYGKFDVVFTELLASDCWSVVAHKMQVPMITIATQPDFAWMYERVGAPDNPSYIVTSGIGLGGKLNLWQRVYNTLAYVNNYLKFKWMIEYPSDAVVREFFGADTPSIAEMTRNTSLVFVNRHVALNPAIPVPPNVVHVAGLHLKDRRDARGRLAGSSLEPGLKRWMDEAEHGVIFFAFGSLIRAATFPRATKDSLLRVFAALPQRVLWKYEEDDLELPPNVRTAGWFSQWDVLAHPKTVLFITHGGLMGTSEAIMLGVPMLGVPLFNDQLPNVALYEHLGIAEKLEHTDLADEALVLATVRRLTETDRYRVRSKEVAARYMDRPVPVSEEVAFWTDYVVRHRGAPHLRPLAADMPLHEYLLLDVVAILLVLVVGAATGALLLVRALLRRLFASGSGPARRPPHKRKAN